MYCVVGCLAGAGGWQRLGAHQAAASPHGRPNLRPQIRVANVSTGRNPSAFSGRPFHTQPVS
eukprot:scaffold155344_cov19-Prasinocladus_malaysianus.AAC.1